MTRAAHMDQQVHSLLSLESYRSPWFPTRRLGQDALVAIAAPSRQQSDVSVVPSTWFAVTPDFRSLLVFARTSVVTPLSDFQPAPVEPLSTALASREAHAALWRLSETAWPDFFSASLPHRRAWVGGRGSAGRHRAQSASALVAAVLRRLLRLDRLNRSSSPVEVQDGTAALRCCPGRQIVCGSTRGCTVAPTFGRALAELTM